MNKEYTTSSLSVVDKLILAIDQLPEPDIHQIIELFSKPTAGKVFSGFLQQHLELKRIERQLQSETRQPVSSNKEALEKEPDKETPAFVLEYAKKLKSATSVLDTLSSVLSDRNLFFSTRDVVNTMKTVCGLEANYEAFRRAGRDKLIRRYQKQLSEMSSKNQKQLAKKLADWLENY